LVLWQDHQDTNTAIAERGLQEGGGGGADGELKHSADDRMCVEEEVEQEEDVETQGSDCLGEEEEAAFLGDIANRARCVHNSARMPRQESPAVDVGEVASEIGGHSKESPLAGGFGKEACKVEMLDRVSEQREEKQCFVLGVVNKRATPYESSLVCHSYPPTHPGNVRVLIV
jgi:hypothetical protein